MLTQVQVYRDGSCYCPRVEVLEPGEHGTIQVLEIMAAIVREDAAQADLRKWLLRDVIRKVPGHDYEGELKSCFAFARDHIVYRRDPQGVERVADMWSTLYALSPGEPEGDCGIKSVFLATSLALVGFEPYFVVIRQTPADVTFHHVYVGVNDGGEHLALDPTPPRERPGWEPKAHQRAYYPIFV